MKTIHWGIIGCGNVTEVKSGPAFQTATNSALVAVMASGAVATAQPDPTPIMYSTCTYPQVIAALTALDPGAAAELQANPIGVGYLHQLIASGPQRAKSWLPTL